VWDAALSMIHLQAKAHPNTLNWEKLFQLPSNKMSSLEQDLITGISLRLHYPYYKAHTADRIWFSSDSFVSSLPTNTQSNLIPICTIYIISDQQLKTVYHFFIVHVNMLYLGLHLEEEMQ
jgi:hypothetical protein